MLGLGDENLPGTTRKFTSVSKEKFGGRRVHVNEIHTTASRAPLEMVRVPLRAVERVVSLRLEEPHDVVLRAGLNGEVEVEGRPSQAIHGERKRADQGMPIAVLLEEAGDGRKSGFEVDRPASA